MRADASLMTTDLAPNRELLLQIAQQLPAAPQILRQLNELLTDVNSGLDAIAQLLRRDTALAGRIIRISNSAAFGMGGRVGSIEEAVNRVGYAEIYRLTGLATAAQMAEQNLSFYGIPGTQLRDNSLYAALAAEALATRTGADSRMAYTAGLLRSTGKLVLDRFANRPPKTAAPFVQSGTGGFLNWEQSNFGCTNPKVAEMVLSAWRFPIEIIQPIGHQYADTPKKGDRTAAAALLHVACGMAHSAGHGLLVEQDCWSVTAETLQLAGLTPPVVSEAAEEVKFAFEAIKGAF